MADVFVNLSRKNSAVSLQSAVWDPSSLVIVLGIEFFLLPHLAQEKAFDHGLEFKSPGNNFQASSLCRLILVKNSFLSMLYSGGLFELMTWLGLSSDVTS